MTSNDIIGLITTCIIGALITLLAAILLSGHGSSFIAGFNTLPEREKRRYDSKALCRFIGKILLPIGVLSPSVAIGGIYGIDWIPLLYAATALGLAIFAVAYCNTGNRFIK